MLKRLLVFALTANLFFIVTVAALKVSKSTSSSSSSTYSSQTSSSSTSYSSVSTSDCDEDRISCGGDPNARPGCDKECRNRCENQETTKCSCPVKNSCECKEGYVFDTVTFKCVLPSNCTRNKLCPNANEVYDKCPAPCPPRRCDVDDRLIKCATPPKVGDPDCKPGCRCADNYVRNDKGVCVKREECPQSCKGPNEVYDQCPALCPPQRCDVNIALILCAVPPKPGDPDCEPGCRCIDDYVRNSSGVCIPRDQCEPQCPANEVYNDCPALVCDPQKCSELGYGVNCTGVAENVPCPGGPGCICKYGYLRNENGVCIPQKECPSCKDDSNAEAGCGIYCNQRCSDIGKEPQGCILMCYPNACDCKEGYYLDENTGKCVLPKDCTQKCGKHEVYSDCINGGCDAKNCSQLGFPIPCVRPKKCIKGCICENGYLRNDKDVCVPRSKCPSCGGDPNAKSGCGVNCGKHCADYFGHPLGCPKICKPNGCDCKKDFYYDDNYKKCVKPEKCSPYCNPNEHEVFSECINGGCQPKNCSQLGKPIPCLKIPADQCIKGCLCEEGYLRASNGTCIPKDQCNPCKRPHEYYDKCPPSCPPQTCKSIGKKYHCSLTEVDPTGKNCKPACRCEKGYYRNKIGECISREDCLKCTGPHEYYSCGGACDNVCETIKKQNQTNCPIINITCNKKCYCEKDYARAKNGTCIPISKCDEPQCPVNEEYEKCPVGLCRPLSCSQLGFPMNCTKIDKCPVKPGCVCKSGHVRNDKGVCIPLQLCPACGGDPNATSGCGFCGQLCSDIGKGPVACPAICKLNGCQCKKGYNYDSNIGKCVLPKDCSPYCNPKKNEVFSKCINGGCQAKNCSQLGKPIPCIKIHPDYCIKGCICKEGYLRASNGSCIPEDQCNPCTRPNEYYDKCPPSCPPQTCGSIGKVYPCPLIKGCFPACRCKEGFFRNKIGECISKENCLKCTGPHEYYSCGGACDNVCETIKKQNQTNCPIINITCNKKCYCEKNYARAKNGTCIPISKCDEPQCEINEEYVKCPVSVCRPLSCSQLGFPINCKQIDPCPVKPGCVCKQGYARNDEGVCVPWEQCPSCGGDTNATTGCGFCGQRCSDIGKEPVVCPLSCKLNGCRCRKGYYYDSNIGKCVLPKDCSPTCKRNERYEKCPIDLCRPQKCTEVGFPIPCPGATKDSKCPVKPGCVCVEDYARNDKGICIPVKECPSCRGDRNATSGCGYCGHRCSDIGKGPVACPRICEVNGCQCKKGYYYDKNIQQCVLPEDCSPQCGVNEQYSNCPSLLCRPENCTEVGFPVPCPRVSENYKCPDKPRCVCISDYVRNEKGVCVPASKCPSCHGDPNAVAGCGYCGNRCSDIGKGPVLCPAICEINGCSCRKGYYYDYNVGKCVLPKECTPQCGRNEKYEKCPSEVCRPQNCTEVGFPINCPVKKPGSKCSDKPGCVCIEDYARNNKGICVPVKECPCGGDPNAMSGCGFCGQYCSDYGRDDIACLAICEINGCQCRKGYYYDKNIKKCVLPKECSPQCGLNEEYIQCPDGLCRPENCTQLGFPVYCSIVTPDTPCSVKPRCVCTRGYARNNKGICVPIDSCPSCGGDSNATSGCGFCGHRCSDIGKDHVICPRIKCEINGCRCKEGYYYNTKIEKCVRPKDCPSVCGKNEEISTCANGGCDKRNCTQLGQPKLCIDPIKCKVGCVCKKGYLRDSKGVCIPIKDCSSCGGDPNAQPGCGNHCNKRCSDIGKEPKLCAQQCKEDGCDCKDGYYFDEITGKCVKPENCSCPKPNQVFDLCPSWCPPQTCESLDRAYICPIEYEDTPEPCVPGCRCKDGYFSNINGQCVTEAQCRQCNGPHEYFDCGVECDNVCATLSEQNQTNCPIVNIQCNPKCYCEKGYARAKNSTCIPIPRCNEPQCGVNEKYEPCPADICRPENCSQLGYPLRCPPETSPVSPCPVKPKCVCIDGYVRNNKGVCIPDYDCPSCRGDPNAKPGCGLCFTKQCPDHGKGVVCAAICDANGCVCRDNYVYDSIQKKCVCLEDCTPICATNEVPSDCVNGGCDKRNCSQLGKPDICINVIKCYKGCICRNGYLRNSEGICVPKDKCPVRCGDNEVFHNCIEGYCDAKTCDDLGFPVACPDVYPERCTKGCLCIDGYVRAANGTCIKKRDCPSCGGDSNAQSGCGVNCGKRCRDIGKKNSVCPLICHVNACDCKPGFYLDENTGKCVLPKKCPPQCPTNEIYNSCVEGDCKPKNCSQLGFPISCPRIDPAKCTGACLCVEGYVRADNGTCIPVKKCPSCGGDDNAESGCGVNCGKHCSHIGKEVACITVCYENACDCKDGYYLNENTGKCVLPKKCPPSCPKDEVYNSCVEEYCKPKNCSQVGFPIKCPKKGSYRCTGGCLCKEGFVRADNGTCIPIKKCPSCGGDPNAESGCGVNCNRHCRDIDYEDTAGACIEICKENSCDCKPGYYYDDNMKECVLPKDCTPECDMPHEVFDKCPPTCPPQSCSSIGKKFFCPNMSVNKTHCKPGCRCEKNYFRNLNGECITRQQCLKCPGPHEYFSCGSPCDNECAKLDIQCKCDCPIKNKKCTERCYCEDGYARNENNICIPIEDCPFPCYDEDITTTTTPKPAPPSENVLELLEKFRQGNIALSLEYVYQKALSDPGVSFVLSALSVLILFSQLLLYSVGLTREQLLRVTNLDSNVEVEKVIPALIKLYGEQTNVTFEMANKCYGNKNYPFSDKFKTDAKEIFHSEGENLDFSKNVEAADIINKWVENKTHNQIKNLIKPSALSADTRLVLINALYFFGRWLRPFNVNNTHDRDFYVSPNKTISISFMYQQSTFNYGEFKPLNAQVLEMKYGGGNFSSIYWLPKDKFGLLDMLEKMRNPALVAQSMDNLRSQNVKVYVPKMEIESELDMVKLSQKANVTEMFKPGSDSFKGILKIDEPVSVTDAVQKAKIITTEEGTTAAAATAVVITTLSLPLSVPEPPIFKADHPFAYAIRSIDGFAFFGVFAN